MTGTSGNRVAELKPSGGPIERNAGMAFNPDLFGRIRINRSAVERRAATLGTRRTVKKEHQAAWLLKALSCIDLTTLAGDDTPGRVGDCARKRDGRYARISCRRWVSLISVSPTVRSAFTTT